MNTNVPAGTAGTIATEAAPAGKLVLLSTGPGATEYFRSDAPIARDATVSFEATLKNAFKPVTGNRDPNAKDVSVLIKNTETWDVTGDVNGYVYPIQVHTVIRVPNHAEVAIADVMGAISRHAAMMTQDRVSNLLRLKTDVA